MIAFGRALTDRLWSPLVPKIVAWTLVLGCALSVALHWLRDAAATHTTAAVVQPRPAVDLEAAIAEAAAAPVFGEAAGSESVPTPVAATLDIRLKGVFAGGGGPMAAIVNTGREEDEFVLLGRELQPGVRLEAVHPSHILVVREGVSHRVELEPVRSETSRLKGATHPSGKPPAHIPPESPTAPEAEASAHAEPESSTPLAAPMPQSDAGPDPHIRAA